MELLQKRLAALSRRYDTIEDSILTVQREVSALAVVKDASQQPWCADTKSLDLLSMATPQLSTEDMPKATAIRQWCLAHRLHSAVFACVPGDYYRHTLQWRREVLGAPAIDYLCKTIVVENTHCVHADCSVRENSRFYMLVYQYVDRFDPDLVVRAIKALNPGLGKKKFNFRLAGLDKTRELTGFAHGEVCPIGTRQQVPVVLSAKITTLEPRFFWVGGGHVNCKVRLDIDEFIKLIRPLVATITVPLKPEELELLLE